MNNSMQAQRLEAAIGVATASRRLALQAKRDAGEPRNPARARLGMEEAFKTATRNAHAYDLIFKLLEKEVRLERARASFPVKHKARKIADRIIDISVGVGLISAAAPGLAAALVLLRYPEPVIQITAVMGVAVALARAVITARK